MVSEPLDPKTRGQLNLVAWTWLLHGVLLVLAAPALWAMRTLVGLIDPESLVHLPPKDRATIEQMQDALAAYGGLVPWSLTTAVLVLPPAVAMVKRRAWGRAGIELVTWLHLVLLFPGLLWFTLTAPPLVAHFDQYGEPNAVVGVVAKVGHVLTICAMDALAVYLLVVVRRPAIREACGGVAPASAE